MQTLRDKMLPKIPRMPPMKTIKNRTSTHQIKRPHSKELPAHGLSTRKRSKKAYKECRNCIGTGEVKEPGRVAVRCPVCHGSGLAHQSNGRQLETFVLGGSD